MQTISKRQFEFVMQMVIEWANDVPFDNWFSYMLDHYGLGIETTRPDYQVVLRDGRPYLYDTLSGGRDPHLDMTTYMDIFGPEYSTKSSIHLDDYTCEHDDL